jgi:hypothetical protein
MVRDTGMNVRVYVKLNNVVSYWAGYNFFSMLYLHSVAGVRRSLTVNL